MQARPDSGTALFAQMRPRLIAISCRILGSQAEAEDVVQDCFLKWHRTNQALLATPAAWLTTVVQHQSIDRLRTRARDDATAHTATELIAQTPPAAPEDELLHRDTLGEALAHMTACLSRAEQMALVLHEAFDCSHADIAAALGTSTVNARQHLARARRRLLDNRDSLTQQEKMSRELIRRFQAAINSTDVPAMVTLLAGEQPVSVLDVPQHGLRAACANDSQFHFALAA